MQSHARIMVIDFNISAHELGANQKNDLIPDISHECTGGATCKQ